MGIVGWPHRPQTLPLKPLDGWQGCHRHPLPRTLSGSSFLGSGEQGRSPAPVLRRATVQGSEVTLHPGDKSLLSFMSEQGGKEDVAQRSRTHCPEIHTLLSLPGILQSDTGRGTSLLWRRQDRKGPHL